MPKALERKLKKEYPNNPHAVYGTLNKIEKIKTSHATPHSKALKRIMKEEKNSR